MSGQPWYKRCRRWVQANLTENDGRDCDVSFWREFWRKNHIQGAIVNAGGTVAYFPSENPYQYRAKFLGERDLLREFIDAAHEENVAVMARMDINQASEQLFCAHPDWFTRGLDGEPYKMGPRYITCINGGYYKEQIPAVMREIIEKYRPEALGDNSWTGGGSLICYCENCKRMFYEYCGMDIPKQVDFYDRAYRLWLQWSMRRRTETWVYFNKTAAEIGCEDCLWIGMLHPEFYPTRPLGTLYDEAQFSEYGKAHMVDLQSRSAHNGFEQNSMTGLMLHQIFGEDALIIESMASYNKGKYFVRKSAGPPEEMRAWMRSGIAGGLVPSPHFIGGVQEDARIFGNCAPMMQWHRDNEQYLFDRRLIANAGIVWSKENLLFHGLDTPMETCFLPFKGFVNAMIRKRIPYYPVNAFHIDKETEKLDVLILPDLACMTDTQLDSVERFVKLGKSVVFTGASGMLDELGYPREDLRLDRLFGITRLTKEVFKPVMPAQISF
ncbi:MAG: beta-galactosidase, partial [Oscillospiraceae bacterium]|nr:beta-galactosidase [Oscillospiraceae bacterium]